mmetsp:Transcript_13745/g.50040  ORF Transcript_13745/g.50040 Transcript_13745/m.50040 type:complete len:96 (+) Transcript_13745:1406-1693(+)
MNFARVNLPTISGSFKEEAIRQRIQDYGHMLGLVWLVFSGPYQHVVAVVGGFKVNKAATKTVALQLPVESFTLVARSHNVGLPMYKCDLRKYLLQ